MLGIRELTTKIEHLEMLINLMRKQLEEIYEIKLFLKGSNIVYKCENGDIKKPEKKKPSKSKKQDS